MPGATVRESAGLLSEVPALLSWDGHSEVAIRAREIFMEELVAALARALAVVAGRDRDDAMTLLAETSAASSEEFTRALTAPATCARISASNVAQGEDLAGFLHLALESERLRATYLRTGSASARESCWTALGDWRFPTGANGRAGAPAAGFDPRETYRAPQLANGVPVDFASPWAVARDFPGFPEPPDPVTAQDAEHILPRLEEAVDVVGQVSAAAGDLVAAFTKVVVLRKSLSVDGYASASSSPFVGRTVLLNPHLMSTVELAEAMIHEAVHPLLFIIELRQPFAETTDVLWREQVASPWTGTALNLSSYIHACFVWFALRGFWARAMSFGAFSRAEMAARLNHCSRGFDAGDLTRPLRSEAVRGQLDPEIPETIRSLQLAVGAEA